MEKKCNRDGCTNYAQKGGLCIKHGAKRARKLGISEGCTNQRTHRPHVGKEGRGRTFKWEHWGEMARALMNPRDEEFQ
eukprot:scaffold11669_cov77-Skeletonema_dohrnii-CCMP3373.AAC.4